MAAIKLQGKRAAAIVACAAMAGVPLLNGFLSKEMFFAESLEVEGHAALRIALPVLATVAGIAGAALSFDRHG